MRATDVVDGLRDLQERVRSQPYFKQVIEKSASLDVHDLQEGQVSWLLAKDGVECFQVTANMVPLVQMAAESLDTSDTFRVDFAPAHEGFVQFETPLKVYDIRNKVLHVSWLRWGTQGDLAWVVAFADSRQPDEVNLEVAEEVPEDILRSLGHWRWSGMNLVQDGEHLTLMGEADRAHARRVKAGEEPLGSTEYVIHDEQVPRFLKALWLLMAQEVGEVSARALDRAGAKRARRLNLPTSVTVIELRRPKGMHLNEEGEGGREYAYRWMVKGHFAWRACSEKHPLAEAYEKGWRVRVWISPYTKNADRDDLPWKMGEKIYVLKQ